LDSNTPFGPGISSDPLTCVRQFGCKAWLRHPQPSAPDARGFHHHGALGGHAGEPALFGIRSSGMFGGSANGFYDQQIL